MSVSLKQNISHGSNLDSKIQEIRTTVDVDLPFSTSKPRTMLQTTTTETKPQIINAEPVETVEVTHSSKIDDDFSTLSPLIISSTPSNLPTEKHRQFKPFPAINKLQFQSPITETLSEKIKTSKRIKSNLTDTLIHKNKTKPEENPKQDSRKKSYNFDSVDFFNRYYRKGWESPQDVKSGYYNGKISRKYSTNVGSIPITKIGHRPFKLSLEKIPRRYHKLGTDLNSAPVTKDNSDKDLNSMIPDFLKYAIPMEKVVPSSIISRRRMDIVLPGYSRTRSYNM